MSKSAEPDPIFCQNNKRYGLFEYHGKINLLRETVDKIYNTAKFCQKNKFLKWSPGP